MTSLNERLAREAHLAREKADQLSTGPERKALLEKARQADHTAEVIDWVSSPGLPPPEGLRTVRWTRRNYPL
jgi:hypothetical protein